MSLLSTSRRKTAAGVAGLMLLAFPLAACGGSDDNSSNSSSSSSTPVKALATVDDLSAKGGMTEVLLDSGFTGALKSLGLTPGTYMKGKLTNSSANGTLEFPITGGWVSLFKPGTVPSYVIGQVQHEGSGFTLTAGKTTVTIGNFNVDPGRSIVYGDVAVNGTVAAVSVPIFDLNGSTLKPITPTSSKVVLFGTKVFLSDTAAGLLDSVFKTKAVKGGLLIGVARITVNL